MTRVFVTDSTSFNFNGALKIVPSLSWPLPCVVSPRQTKLKVAFKGATCTRLPLCVGSREQGCIVRSLTSHFYKKLFPRLEHVTSWSHSGNFTNYAKVKGATTRSENQQLLRLATLNTNFSLNIQVFECLNHIKPTMISSRIHFTTKYLTMQTVNPSNRIMLDSCSYRLTRLIQ